MTATAQGDGVGHREAPAHHAVVKSAFVDAHRTGPLPKGLLGAVDVVADRTALGLGKLRERLDHRDLGSGPKSPLGVLGGDRVEHPIREVLVLNIGVHELRDADVTMPHDSTNEFERHPKIDEPLAARPSQIMRGEMLDPGGLGCFAQLPLEILKARKQSLALALAVLRSVLKK